MDFRAIGMMTAQELMSPIVMTIPEEMSIAAAAEKMAEANVKGAPVVDAAGNCVGVISTTDFLYLARKKGSRPDTAADSGYFPAWQIADAADLPRESVSRFMTKPPRVVAPETPIGELAHLMVDSHMRRMIVVEPSGKMVGVVTTTDLLRALARFVDADGRPVGT